MNLQHYLVDGTPRSDLEDALFVALHTITAGASLQSECVGGWVGG